MCEINYCVVPFPEQANLKRNRTKISTINRGGEDKEMRSEDRNFHHLFEIKTS